MCLKLVDQTIWCPVSIAKDVLAKIRHFFVTVDFVVLEMEMDKTSLILGRPFLSTANADINVGFEETEFTINGKTKKFAFKPRMKKCSKISINSSKRSERINKYVHPAMRKIRRETTNPISISFHGDW